MVSRLPYLLIACVFLAYPAAALAQLADAVPEGMQGVDVDEQLGEFVDLDLEFINGAGERVALRDFVRGEKPVIFTLNYYDCPMLCDLQLNALVDTLGGLDWTPGEDFEIVTISFDPEEGPELARDKQRAYRASLGRGDDAGWHFLVGERESIDALTEQFGYLYRYLPEQEEFSHPSVLMFISPNGRITRYIYGLAYESSAVRMALLEASEGTVGTTIDRIILSCFVYDPDRGEYVPFAFGIMRLAGAITVAFILLMLILLWRRERRQPSPQHAAQG